MLRKKWLSLLVAISMVAAMFPSTVFADTVEATEPVEPQTSVTETAQDEKDPVEGGEQPEVVDNENTATGEGDKGAGQSDEDETVTEETEEETKEPETPADGTEEKTEDAEEPASEEADPDEETVVVPPVTAPEVTETPVAGNSAVDTQTLTDGDNTDDGINTEEALRKAIEEASEGGTTITLSGDVAISSTLTIDKAVTLNLGTYKIYADTDFKKNDDNNQNHLVDITASGVKVINGTLEAGVNNNHTLNVWNAKSVTLENLTLDNTNTYEGAPLIVGASDVTLKGTITTITGENSWYAINVDCRKVGGAAVPATLTADAKVLFQGVAVGKPGICVENTAGTTPADAKVVFAGGFSNTDEGAACSEIVSIHPDNKTGAQIDSWIGYDVVEGAVARIGWDYYTDLAAACAAAKDNDTVVLCISQEPVELDSKLVLGKDGVTLDLNGNKITAAADFTSADGQPHLVEVTANNVTIKDGTLLGTQDTKHGLHVYGGNVTLENVEIDATATGGASGNYHAAVVVNGAGSDKNASLALKGAVTLKAASEAINVDTNGGAEASLTVAENATVDLSGCASGIVVCDPEDKVSFEENVNLNLPQSGSLLVNDSADGATISGIENIAGIDPAEVGVGAVVTTNGESKVYSDFKDAYQAAVADSTIKLYEDVQLDSKLVINTEGLTLDLNGKTISASDSFNTKGHLVEITANGVRIVNGTIKGNANVDHALHVWNADKVTLGDGLVLDNAATTVGGAPLVIGGSNVTLEGNTTFVTGENSWYGANVDTTIVGGAKKGSSLTVNGHIAFEGKNQNNVGIWVQDEKDGSDTAALSVTFGKGSSAQGNGDPNFEIVHMADPKYPDNNTSVSVGGLDNVGLIPNGNGGFIVKPAPVEETPSHEHSYVWQGSPDEHWQYCTDCGQVVSNGAHTFQWKDGVQVCSVCGYKVTETATASAPAANANTAAAAPAAGTAAAAVATGIPQTGDESNPLLWVVLLAVSGSALGGMVIYKKKKEN